MAGPGRMENPIGKTDRQKAGQRRGLAPAQRLKAACHSVLRAALTLERPEHDRPVRATRIEDRQNTQNDQRRHGHQPGHVITTRSAK